MNIIIYTAFCPVLLRLEIVSEHERIENIKTAIKKRTGVDIQRQNLYYRGFQLDDSRTFKDYGISENEKIYLDEKFEEKATNIYPSKVRDDPHDQLKNKHPEPKEIKKNRILTVKQKPESKKKNYLYWDVNCHDGAVNAVASTSDGKYIISCSEDNSIKVFDLANKEEVYHFTNAHEGPILSVTVTNDNHYIISGSKDKSIKLFDFTTRQEVHCFKNAHEDYVRSVAVTKDNKYIVSGSDDKSIKVFDLTTKQEVHQFSKTHEGPVLSVALTSDNRYIISGSGDFSVKVFDLTTKQEVMHIPYAHIGDVSSVAVTNDSKYIISGGISNSIKVFDFTSKKELHQFIDYNSGSVSSIAVTNDSKYIIAGSTDRSVKVFDLATKQEVHRFSDYIKDSVLSLTVTNDNKYLILGSKDNSIKVLDFTIKQEVHHFPKAHQKPIISVVVTKDNKYLISGSADKSIKVFDLAIKQEVYCFADAHKGSILSVAVTNDNKYIVSCSEDKTIKIFDLTTKQEVYCFSNIQQTDIRSVAVTNDNKYIISFSLHVGIKVFDFETKEEVKSFPNNYLNKPAFSFTVTNDNKYVIVGTTKSIQVLELFTHQLVHEFPNCHEDYIRSIAVTKDNKYIVSGSDDKSIKVFDLITKQEVHHFSKTHEGPVLSVAVTTDNKYIISGSGDKSLKVFDLTTKQEVHHFTDAHKEQIWSVAVTSDNKHIISASIDGDIKVFNFPENSYESSYFISPTLSPFLAKDCFSSNLLRLLSKESPISQPPTHLQDFCYFPHRWNILHILAINCHPDIPEITDLSILSVSWMLDIYGKTPLHYLIKHNKLDPTLLNSMFKYILDYLNSLSPQSYQFHCILSSTSGILYYLIKKVQSRLINQYLDLCYTTASHNHPFHPPEFGQPQTAYLTTSGPMVNAHIVKLLHKDGLEPVSFKTVNFYYDYSPNSDDMMLISLGLQTVSNEEFFKSKAFAHLLNYLWFRTRYFRWFAVGLFSVFMTLLSVYVAQVERNLPLETIILLLTCLFFTGEFLHLKSVGLSYFKNLWNWIDLIHLIAVGVFIIIRFSDTNNHLGIQWLVSVIIFEGYIRWLSCLRIFQSTRNLLQMIMTIILDMRGFIVILCFIIIGFSLIFLEFERDTDYITHLYKTYKLLYSDFEDDVFSPSQKVFLSLFLFILSVILLNILISIMGDSFDKVVEKRVLTDSMTRLELILEAMTIQRSIASKKQQTQKQWLMVYGPKRDEEESNADQNEWEGRINTIRKLLKQNEQKVDQKIEEIKKETIDINKKIEQIQNKIDSKFEIIPSIIKSLLEEKHK